MGAEGSKKPKPKKKPPPKITAKNMTRRAWDEMLMAWRQRPTVRYVSKRCMIGEATVKRAVHEGWPSLGLPPLAELATGSNVHFEMAVQRESWAERAIVEGEAARQAAEEALAARTVMRVGLDTLKKSQTFLDKCMKRLDEAGEDGLPETITPKVLLQLVTATEKSTGIVERAMKLERMRAGEPEMVMGIVIGQMIERLSDSELLEVIESKAMPSRLVDQRRTVLAQLSTVDESDEETAALATAEDDDEAAEDTPGTGGGLTVHAPGTSDA